MSEGLINEQNILDRFNANLAWASNVDIASAWATANHALHSLQDKCDRLQIRAIIGLWNSNTDPDALRTLNEIGELRLSDEDRFHPKVIVFSSDKKAVAWVGSANFTKGGFEKNIEAVFETHNVASVSEWFKNLWKDCGRIKEGQIDEYAEKYNNKKQQNPDFYSPRSDEIYDGEFVYLGDNVDWKSYVEALESNDKYWVRASEESRNQGRWSILGEHDSWMETIQAGQMLVRRSNWGAFSNYERGALLGYSREGKAWGLLGDMLGLSHNAVFGPNLEQIQTIVQGVINIQTSDVPAAVLEVYEQLDAIEGIGKGIATRLLTLARPDMFVSLNGGSINGLVGWSAIKKSDLEKGEPKAYVDLLSMIYEQPWYLDPEPTSPQEEAIKAMRVALVDSFMYDPEKSWTVT